MNRRKMLYGGVAAVAGLAGAGVAWRKFKPHEVPAVSPAVAAASFWATWCPPCVEELPLLDFFYQENKDKNIQVVGLAVDQPSAVRTWLQTRPLNFPVGMAGLGGTELSKALGNQAGGLPFSVLFAPSGELLQRKVGKLSPEELTRWTKLS